MPEPDTTPAACGCGAVECEICTPISHDITTPARPACRWPDCLSPDQQTQLANEVTAVMPDHPSKPMPDQRGICGCAEAETALRERYAAAARTVRLHLGPNAIAMAQRGEGIIPNYGEADRIADAVLAVSDQEMQALRAELAATVENLNRADEDGARFQVIARRLIAHAAGFQDVLDDSDRDPWARTVRADLNELRAALTPPALGGHDGEGQ